MFSHLPDNLNIAIEQGIIPWTEKIREDYHVTLFKDGQSIIFVAKYPTMRVFSDCLEDAVDEGRKMIQEGKCGSFKLSYMFDSTVMSWPYIRLTFEENIKINKYKKDDPGEGTIRKQQTLTQKEITNNKRNKR